MSSEKPIGVFDSGIGGMTVVKELMNELPEERFIYYGDTARVPYGGKSKETIISYSRQIASFLMTKDVKAIVVACNTASALALEELRAELPVPVVGVVKPGAKAAAEATRTGRIGVIATRATILSGVYEEFLRKTNPDITVFTQACPLFVPLVEEGLTNDEITDLVIHRYLDPLVKNGIDSLVLGCTHYPLLKESIRRIVGDGITLVNPAFETARAFKYVLEEDNLLNTEGAIPPVASPISLASAERSSLPAEKRRSPAKRNEYYVSDSPENFRAFANSVLGSEVVGKEDVFVHKFE